MNALVTIEPAPHGEGHTLFSPRRQDEFLTSLQLFGRRSVQGPARGEGGAGFVSYGAAR